MRTAPDAGCEITLQLAVEAGPGGEDTDAPDRPKAGAENERPSGRPAADQ